MGSDSFMMLFDVIIFCYGVYMVYSAYQMRRTEQPPTMLINPMELVGARDVKGFCEAMFRPFVVAPGAQFRGDHSVSCHVLLVFPGDEKEQEQIFKVKRQKKSFGCETLFLCLSDA